MKKVSFSSQMVFIGLFLANSVLAGEIQPPPGSAGSIKEAIVKITDAVAAVVGPVAAIMFAVAGIMFLISAGKPEMVSRAKKCLMYAVIGTIIALAPEIIVDLIFGSGGSSIAPGG